MGTSVLGTTGDDDLVGVGMDGAGSGSQVHMWAGQGDDTLRLDFDSNFNNTKFHSQGHHARGDADGGNAGQGLGSGLIGVYAGNVNLQQYRGEDQFRFENTANVTGIAYGRIEDFQLGEDKIFVDGIELDMSNMTAAGQALPGGGHAKVVLEQGAHDDPGAVPQYYLLIETSSGGTIFYALEGARVDMVGTPPNSGDQELHFLNYANRPDWSSHVAVDYEDPQNYIPAAYLDLNVSGQKIIDYDSVRQDVLDIIYGTSNDDLIAAGLNDDTVYGGSGQDTIWGGSGHDELHGEDGNDVIYGNLGDDKIFGGGNGDILYGGSGNDEIHTGWGWDIAYGGSGDDSIIGAGGRDVINGGSGKDTLFGGSGNDEFVFEDFDLGFDVIDDFQQSGNDKIRFGGEIDNYSDLIFLNYMYEGAVSTLIRFKDSSGVFNPDMGGIVLAGVQISTLGSNDFIF